MQQSIGEDDDNEDDVRLDPDFAERFARDPNRPASAWANRTDKFRSPQASERGTLPLWPYRFPHLCARLGSSWRRPWSRMSG